MPDEAKCGDSPGMLAGQGKARSSSTVVSSSTELGGEAVDRTGEGERAGRVTLQPQPAPQPYWQSAPSKERPTPYSLTERQSYKQSLARSRKFK